MDWINLWIILHLGTFFLFVWICEGKSIFNISRRDYVLIAINCVATVLLGIILNLWHENIDHNKDQQHHWITSIFIVFCGEEICLLFASIIHTQWLYRFIHSIHHNIESLDPFMQFVVIL